MRTITISGNEYWRVPEEHVQVPAFDLFFIHNDTSKADGATDTLTISGKTYKSVFYNKMARFYVGEWLQLNASLPTKYTAAIGAGVDFTVWHGIVREQRTIPEILWKGFDYKLQMIPASTGNKYLCAYVDGNIRDEDYFGQPDDMLINGTDFESDYALLWIGFDEPIPSTAKQVRILEPCPGDYKVNFILQNGETRVWWLHKKKQLASFSEIISYPKTSTYGGSGDEITTETTEGKNEITTTLYISGLRKSELDEISQLAVSRYVEVDGVQAEIVRRSAVISGNSRGGIFTIDVKGSL